MGRPAQPTGGRRLLSLVSAAAAPANLLQEKHQVKARRLLRKAGSYRQAKPCHSNRESTNSWLPKGLQCRSVRVVKMRL
jgi:hypothetical protein